MTRKADLETVRAAFRIAGLADGGIESFDDVGLELLWQIAEIRERIAGYEAQANEDITVSVSQTAEINRLKAQQELKPAWHDAPTVPGLWLAMDGRSFNITPDVFVYPWGGLQRRWYGPIPYDS